MRVGVFDSGIGGISVAQAIERSHPELDVQFMSDTVHMPYGTKSPTEVLGYVLPILHQMVEDGCAVIVIACNTVTTTLITELRQTIPVPLVAIEPMVKPATALTKTGVIAVCATPTTLASPRYAALKAEFAQGVTVLEPDCSRWASMIEHSQIDEQHIQQTIEQVLSSNADVIVLGCTHYHWIEESINKICSGKATVIQPEQALIAQLERVIADQKV